MTIATLQLLPALQQGGVERSTIEMAIFLKQQGHAPHVASAGGRMVTELEAHNIPHHTLPLHSKNPLTIIRNVFRLSRLLKQENIQLVHVRSRIPAWIMWLTHKRTGIPYIATFHGTYGHKNAIKRCYNRVMLKGMRVIANSAFIRQHIHQVYGYPKNQIPVALRGFDPAQFNPAAIAPTDETTLRNNLNMPTDVPIILMVGRLTPWKGHRIFIQALKQLKDNQPDLPWQALIVGGAQKASWEKILISDVRQYQLTEQVHFLGNRTDIPLLNKIATVAVSASTNPEAFGRVALEAQAMRTPIIATAHGGSLETVQDGITGWLIPPQDATALAAKLVEALTNPSQTETMGQQAEKWVNHHFTTLATCQAEYKVYKEVLNI